MGPKRSKKRSKHRNQNLKFFPEQEIPNMQNDPTVIAEVESLFKKHFAYRKADSIKAWTLPPPDSWFTAEPWVIDVLQEYKEKLNDIKASLSELDISQWHEHTQFTNRAGQVIQHLKRTRKPELCTQAWCKFHEIVASFPLIFQESKPSLPDARNTAEEGSVLKPIDSLCSVHLCEAPGAFITSLNHYLQCRGFTGSWSWLGNTLNPYYEGNALSEMITDDRLIIETIDHWYFGRDNTGDVMVRENVEGLVERVATLGPVDLVTCDGSIDCQDKPGDQEILVSPLHYSEVAASLLLLSAGGSLVVKMFTMLEASSVCLMYLLNCIFRQVSVFKPATSKSGNSEVYVICTDMQSMDAGLRSELYKLVGRSLPQQPLFKRSDLPPEFLLEHQQCCQLFMKYQTQTIEENIALYKDMPTDTKNRITAIRHQCASSYVSRFRVRPLSSHSYIVPPFEGIGAQQFNRHVIKGRKPHTGSFFQRQDQLSIPWEQRLQNMTTYDIPDPVYHWLECPQDLLAEEVASWSAVLGKSPDKILCSAFCDTQLLQLYNSLLEHQQEEKTDILFANTIEMLLSLDDTKMEEDEHPRMHIAQLDEEAGQLISQLREHKCFKVISLEDNSEQKTFLSDQGLVGSENMTKLVRALHRMFTVIEDGENCLFVLPDVLTRCRAGILYILYASFRKIHLEPVSPDGLVPVVVTCKSFKCSEKQAVSGWLEKVIGLESESQDAGKAILEIVPIYILLGQAFCTAARKTNEILIKARTNYMIRHQKKIYCQNEVT